MKKFQKINSVLFLDKPFGFSSNAILQKVKKILKVKKAGYIGTLDPIATGMLPICFGEATKFSNFFLVCKKTYIVSAILGVETDTGDCTGRVIFNKEKKIKKEQIKKIVKFFLGKLDQIPPIYSAIKYKGIPLYKYARKNIPVKIRKKKIKIYSIKILKIKGKIVFLKICCSKGTYIRSIIRDIGKKLGCGAHVSSLRRISISCYNKSHMIKFSRIKEYLKNEGKYFSNKNFSFLFSIEVLVKHLPKLYLSREEFNAIRIGKLITVKNKKISFFTCYSLFLKKEKVFFGVGKLDGNQVLKIKRILSSQLLDKIME
ncbi:tRNA pseudouridine(55) synthase TruB [bacterium endosymbiont of Pedicinus badii]|uniref:tRNA pseudouridine(55) synthase TruB n=1 Tax=bacterium endosymbiont of Pedicinus badii TaxID=1719126 RepID=UPI0009C8581D|nr:tRNA pseudouridine(55) synthase TruB [bacterium endosymbiont of Pedicinus badii]OQM34194.1 hypothetical protein AOQ89_02575 [bacterium endosymbiont of Pedicinus badii]